MTEKLQAPFCHGRQEQCETTLLGAPTCQILRGGDGFICGQHDDDEERHAEQETVSASVERSDAVPDLPLVHVRIRWCAG